MTITPGSDVYGTFFLAEWYSFLIERGTKKKKKEKKNHYSWISSRFTYTKSIFIDLREKKKAHASDILSCNHQAALFHLLQRNFELLTSPLEYFPVKLRLKIDLVSYPAPAERLVYIYIFFFVIHRLFRCITTLQCG